VTTADELTVGSPYSGCSFLLDSCLWW